MSDSFFEYIDGLSSEDLTTEIIKYILHSKSYSVYQRIFYQLILKDQRLNDTEQFMFNIESQVDLHKSGRPDLVIENDKFYIVIENKFYAEFSNSNQMYRYYSHLKNNITTENKYLILLTIKDREKYYNAKVIEQFQNKINQISSFNHLLDYLKTDNITYLNIFWDDIIKCFDSSDFIIKNLSLYISQKYLFSTILNKKELKMINSSEIPEVIDKLWGGIDKIKDNLSGEKYMVERTTQSRLFYGFAIKNFWGKVWIEYSHSGWTTYKTPYFLHIWKNWLDENYFDINTTDKLTKIGFILDKELEFVFPIKIEENDIVGFSIPIILEKLKELSQIFKS